VSEANDREEADRSSPRAKRGAASGKAGKFFRTEGWKDARRA